MYTYTYLLCVRACVFVYSSVHTCVCVGGGGPTHMCMGRSVCVSGGGGGGPCTCVWMCALHARVCGMGWGCTHMCTCVCAIQDVCMCSLNTDGPPDSINFVIIVISCPLKLKFAIHVKYNRAVGDICIASCVLSC